LDRLIPIIFCVKVEGSICVVYVHKETSYFLSHYFIDRVLVPTTARNDVEFLLSQLLALQTGGWSYQRYYSQLL